LVIGPILSLYRINGSLAVMSADVGRKPCKRNDSFFENAGKPCKSPTMMWIKSRWHLHSRNADGATPKPPLQCEIVQETSRHRKSKQTKSRPTQFRIKPATVHSLVGA
jgi:hypothetical protein